MKYVTFDDFRHDTAVKILREYVDVKDINQSEQIGILPMTIIDMMLEYGAIMIKEEERPFAYKLTIDKDG